MQKLYKEAANKKSKGVVKLAKKPEFNFAFMSSNELLAKKFEHPKLETLKTIIENEKEITENLKIIVFTQYRDTAALISKELNSIPNTKSKVFIGQANKAQGGLSQKEQKEIINEFREGEINILCATSIGEEGLDIPEVNAVIFYEPVPSAIRAIQRAGRTARLMPGKLIILITKGTRDEAYYYVSRAKEKKMHKAINTIKNTLNLKENKDVQKKL
jgi:Fanconi anemia group M protein